MRGCLALVVGFVLGAALMLVWWPRPPGPAVPPPQSFDVRVTIADGYLSRVAQQRVASISVPTIRHVSVASSPPAELIVSADAAVGPVSAPITLALQPVAEGGAVQVHVVSAHVAAIPVPAPLTGVVSDSINASARRLVGANARITGVVVTPFGLEIYANYR